MSSTRKKISYIKELINKSKKYLSDSEKIDKVSINSAIDKVNGGRLLVKKALELLEALEAEKKRL